MPRWLKLTYAGVVLALVPPYVAQYGFRDFLWFSNIALLTTLVAIWFRSRLLASMMAVGVLVPEIGWNIGFFGGLLFGFDLFGELAYMFDERIPLWTRLASLYHVPLPFLLLWLVWKWGYDPRAVRWQTALAWVVLPLSFLVSAPRENINLVYGVLDEYRRPLIEPPFALFILMAGLPLLVYWPTHLLLRRWFTHRAA